MLMPIENKIFIVRGQRVMFDRDLASLYGVTTGSLNQAVKRNEARFPEDFMFQLDVQEFEIWKSQIVISRGDRKAIRHRPYAFTEYGVAMLSSVLRSDRAIRVNIQIMRTFGKLREIVVHHADLQKRIDVLELRYDQQFKIIFDAMRRLITEDEESKSEIGFKDT